MMKKGVMTVYFSLVFMLVMSFLLVLLESDRLYILRTEGERYADMAAEMVFNRRGKDKKAVSDGWCD